MASARGNSWAGVLDVVRIYWALLLGNVLEWYEYAVFSFLEPYFQRNFFQGSAVASWLGFAVTFVARPFGGLVLGLLGDVFGRKVSTFLSIVGMMIGTVGQGLLPSYQNGEVAGTVGLCLLVALRLLQGICTGGEIAAVSTYITEVGSKASLCRSMMLIGITCNVGFLLAQSASYGLEFLGKERMDAWGWRLPFLVALIPGSIATLGRRCMPESAAFLEQTEPVESETESQEVSENQETRGASACRKMRQLIKAHWPNLLVGIGCVVSVSVLQYGGFVWCSVLLQKMGTEPEILLTAGVVARVSAIFMVPWVAWLADLQGVAWIHFLGSLMLTLLGLPLYAGLVENFDNFLVVVACYGLGFAFIFTFIGMFFFQYMVELFPTSVRNAGVGLSYNIGFCCFGGFAPMIFEAAFQGNRWAPGWLLSACGLITSVSVAASLYCARTGKMQLAHIRPKPYFSPCGRREDEGKAAEFEL